jgi:hypothetical protein
MVCSAVFIMDLKGKILISRNYRGDIPMSVSEKFTKHLYGTTKQSNAATLHRGSALQLGSVAYNLLRVMQCAHTIRVALLCRPDSLCVQHGG